MDTQQNARLHEWIARGKQSGRIREARTVVLAYGMDERAVLDGARYSIKHRRDLPGEE